MAAVWFILTIPTEQHQLNVSAQQSAVDKDKEKVEANRHHVVTFQAVSTPLLNREKQEQEKKQEQEQEQEQEAEQENKPKQQLTRSSSSLDVLSQSEKSNNGSEKAESTMEEVLRETLHELNMFNAVWNKNPTHDFYQVTFPADFHQCETILQKLKAAGFGSKYKSTLSVLPCTLHYQKTDESQLKLEEEIVIDSDNDSDKTGVTTKTSKSKKKFLDSIKSRLTVAQVVEGVQGSAQLTFDYIMFIILAGFLAAIGLIENSSVILVASMLVSPMMGPILAATFGMVIRDQSLQKLGVRNELIALGLCISVGFITGILHGTLHQYSDNFWLTSEMVSRGQLRSLWVGSFIALLSGVGVALSVLGGNAGSLVGVAISASLLPPAVNAGLLWGSALNKQIASSLTGGTACLTAPNNYTPSYSDNMVIEASILGTLSLCLTIINILCIVITGVLVLKIKEVAPDKAFPDTKRFWKEDIKTVRDYNRTISGNEARDTTTVLNRILDEWEMHGFNDGANTVNSEGRRSQLQHNMVLERYMSEIENDPVYRTVRHWAGYPAETSLHTWHPSRDRTPSGNSVKRRSDNTSQFTSTSGAGRSPEGTLSSHPKKSRLYSLFHPMHRFTVTPAADDGSTPTSPLRSPLRKNKKKPSDVVFDL